MMSFKPDLILIEQSQENRGFSTPKLNSSEILGSNDPVSFVPKQSNQKSCFFNILFYWNFFLNQTVLILLPLS